MINKFLKFCIILNYFFIELFSVQQNLVSYYKGKYSSDHWALQKFKFENPNVIAFSYYKNCEYAIFINPTDKRGYRSIVALINNDKTLVMNRLYTVNEKIGLVLTMHLIADVYSKFVPIVQMSILGNNSQSFDQKTGTIFIGNSQEPCILHGHIYARGNPQYNYIEDVKLDGPIPGLVFDGRAKTIKENGNDKKIPWKSEEIRKVTLYLKSEIEKIKSHYKELGLVVTTSSSLINSAL